MPWKRVTDEGDVQKWAQGLVVTGNILERRTNKFGPLVVLSTESGPATYGCPAMLEKKTSALAIGALVRIQCDGKVTGESGQEYWRFTVDVDEGAAPPVATATPSGEDIPF